MVSLVKLYADKQSKLLDAIKEGKKNSPYYGHNLEGLEYNYFADAKYAYKSLDTVNQFTTLYSIELNHKSLTNVPAFKKKAGAIGYKLFAELDQYKNDTICVTLDHAFEELSNFSDFLEDISDEPDDPVTHDDIEEVKYVSAELLDLALYHVRHSIYIQRERFERLSEYELMVELGYSNQEMYDYYHIPDFDKSDLIDELIEARMNINK